jgi:hypothetical protein
MDILEFFKERFGIGESPPTDSEKRNIVSDSEYDNELDIDQMEPGEIEQVFSDMPHESRIKYVSYRKISYHKWRETYVFIQRFEVLYEKWGLSGKQIVFGEEGRKCFSHDASAEPRVLSHQLNRSSTRAKSHSENLAGEVGSTLPPVSGKIAGERTATDERSSTLGSTIGDTKTVWECGTGSKDCKLNRRSFIKTGEYYMTTGHTQKDKLDEEFERVVREASIGSNTNNSS